MRGSIREMLLSYHQKQTSAIERLVRTIYRNYKELNFFPVAVTEEDLRVLREKIQSIEQILELIKMKRGIFRINDTTYYTEYLNKALGAMGGRYYSNLISALGIFRGIAMKILCDILTNTQDVLSDLYAIVQESNILSENPHPLVKLFNVEAYYISENSEDEEQSSVIYCSSVSPLIGLEVTII